MKRITLLDDTDALLLKTISKYPKISQAELAKKMKLTQAAISYRLRELREKGLVQDPGIEIHPKSIGFKMMKVDMQTEKIIWDMPYSWHALLFVLLNLSHRLSYEELI